MESMMEKCRSEINNIENSAPTEVPTDVPAYKEAEKVVDEEVTTDGNKTMTKTTRADGSVTYSTVLKMRMVKL